MASDKEECQNCKSKGKNFFFRNDWENSLMDICLKNNINLSGNVDVCFYTDGVSLFKKSKFSFWPFYFVFCDLDYKRRYLLSNIVILGIWYGSVNHQ